MFEIHFKTLEPSDTQIKIVTDSITAPPNDLVLGGIAAACALVGSAAKDSLSLTPSFGISHYFFAAFLGFVVFSVYDYIRAERKWTLPFNWSTATFIGFICGIFTNEILDHIGKLLKFK